MSLRKLPKSLWPRPTAEMIMLERSSNVTPSSVQLSGPLILSRSDLSAR